MPSVGLAGRRAARPAHPPYRARVRGLLAQLEWFDGHGERALELIDAMEAPGAWLASNFRFPAAIAAGDVLATLGRESEARARYGEALIGLEHRRGDAPDDPKLLVALGLAYAGLGRTAEAVSHAARAVALRPRTEDAAEGSLFLYLLARVHARLGQVSDALTVLDEMFDGPSFYSEAWVQHDPSFAPLRADPSYGARVERSTRQKGEALLAPGPDPHAQ